LVPIINPPFADNSPHLIHRNKGVAMTTGIQLAQRYERLYSQLVDLLNQTENRIARLATVAALLFHKMPHYFWTGFYLLDKEQLTVGPYQGPLACQVLEKDKGVCWAAVSQRKTIVVPDVHEFPGHISCDSRSNAEIAVPLLRAGGEPWAVLDVDSRKLDAFSETDREWLEKIVGLI
jgi:L-methionine (R)-S-oxide reductase